MAWRGLWERVENTRSSVERNRGFGWLSLFFTVKGLVALGVGVVEYFVGVGNDINPFYAVLGALVAVAVVLTIWNKVTVRRGLKTGPTGTNTEGAMAQPFSHKQRATVTELAQGTIADRQVHISDLPLELNGSIRQKTFVDCDFFGPAVILLTQCTISGITFAVAANTTESILWPVNPNTPAIVGAVVFEQCRFDRGQFFSIGLAGLPADLDQYRQSIPPPG